MFSVHRRGIAWYYAMPIQELGPRYISEPILYAIALKYLLKRTRWDSQ
jgi:hypothetical protein